MAGRGWGKFRIRSLAAALVISARNPYYTGVIAKVSVVLRVLAALALLATLPGCEKTQQAPKPGAELKPPFDRKSELPVLGGSLLDGFEGPEYSVWAFDSADDEGLAQYVTEGATQGQKALRITLRGKGSKGRIHLRREVDLNFSQASAMLCDITSPADGLSAVLGLKTNPGDALQECRPVPLNKGLNRDVRFPLEGSNWKNAQSKGEFNGPPVSLQSVRRIMLLLYTGDESSGSFLVDNLRVEGALFQKPEDAAAAYREWRPEILLVNYPPEGATQYQGLEVQAVFRASYRDIFDPSEIALGLRLTTPSGKNLDVRGFFGGLGRYGGAVPQSTPGGPLPPLFGPLGKKTRKRSKDREAKGEEKDREAKGEDKDQEAKESAKAKEEAKQSPLAAPKDEDSGGQEGATHGNDAVAPQNRSVPLPVWVVRFTPQETGRYTLQLYVRNAAGEARTPERSLVIVPEVPNARLPGRKGGNVCVSRRDPRQFELQDGSPFYIVGQNVCWTTDWAPYLEKIKAYGGNTCRVWLCPWGLNLERKQEPGTYGLKEAERLDELFELAESTGVRLILCLTYHGATGTDWGDSPYNQANGGPCQRPQDFFTDWRAKRQFKRLLSYAAARWGSSPALLCWELMNELDIAHYENPEDAMAWTREMAAHLKSADAHGHLVTVSTVSPHFQPELWQDPRLDFVSVHGYGTDVSRLVQLHLAPFRLLSKPVLLAEFGGGYDARDDVPDKDGARLQAALWLTACSPACGTALPWWWDTYIESRNLYPLLSACARFVAGDERRARFGEWVRKSYVERSVEVTGVMDNQGARLYVHNPTWTRLPETRGPALLAEPLPLELSGLLDGAYRVEFWDAREGKAFSTSELAAKSSKLGVQLPAHAAEFGVRIERKEHEQPQIESPKDQTPSKPQ